jgi:hypothetical protein
MATNDRQPGGDHYKRFGELQPWDVITHFNLGFMDGNAVKYLLRGRYKSADRAKQIEDLEKATHYIEKQLELLRPPKARTREEAYEDAQK